LSPIERLFQSAPRASLVGILSLLLVACGGGGSSSDASNGVTCSFPIASTPQSLTAAETERIIAQAQQAAASRGVSATIAVVDRVGNVLGVYNTAGNAAVTVNLRSGRALSSFPQGLDGLDNTIPASLAAIAKAVTGAYLSSSGNAFSTRTASYIIQEHFPPTVDFQAGGPLFGVQFSQLPCGDFVTRGTGLAAGPKRSPLGLAGDPGGFPIYKNGRVVGGIGVMADGVYGIDLNPVAGTTDNDEIIAQSALAGFQAPDCIRANRITLGGQIPSYSNADGSLISVNATTVNAANFIDVATYFTAAGGALAGRAYGNADSGFTADGTGTLGAGAFVVTNGAANRFPATASTNPAPATGLSAAEVTQIINSAIGVANQARAQIRRPLNSPAQVTVSIVDVSGNVLGVARTADAPIFGADVSLQKARTAAFFSSTNGGTTINGQSSVTYLIGGPTITLGNYVSASNTFGTTSFTGANAFSARAIGNIARPLFPDGINGTPNGPLSKPLNIWSPFSTGLQLDLVYNALTFAILNPADANNDCSASPPAAGVGRIQNGIQIFPGAVPIYRGSTLIGAIGVSGDGVDQDDMIAFLGLSRAGTLLGTGVANAPSVDRADTLNLPGQGGVRLRYVQCPQSPFINSSAQNVCSGI